MAYEYKWKILGMEGFRALEVANSQFEDVIGKVVWECEVKDTDDWSVHWLRQETLLQNSDLQANSYIDYLEIDEETVLEWIWSTHENGRVGWQTKAKDELNAIRFPPDDVLRPMTPAWIANCCPSGEEFFNDGITYNGDE